MFLRVQLFNFRDGHVTTFRHGSGQWRRQDFSLGGRIQAPRGRGAKGAEGGGVRF